uniref:Cation/H+ exchanger transmembrane domain-containing protein n=1 Tax=Chromera velia CCMP2878 TaxID=1169474 RepID=A0A0G4HHY8_9ALVE|eukprot:Cvel_6930.t1-p1 / transcript=Cvel_6930.t1 / gene=Cvel_6930 / organism=Chromera_velia_CCMP2878 / gene_product=K( ) efflux antiporter 5, putative / transcript_product=K( ) efflux antiporter 5, putative / location=Cvel_scaffold351:617-11669(-) / protein_length=977 / sequence_SO=supercontig / SO=protein_coding / is_pseudo=false
MEFCSGSPSSSLHATSPSLEEPHNLPHPSSKENRVFTRRSLSKSRMVSFVFFGGFLFSLLFPFRVSGQDILATPSPDGRAEGGAEDPLQGPTIQLNRLIPNKGPDSGGTVVTIEGFGFGTGGGEPSSGQVLSTPVFVHVDNIEGKYTVHQAEKRTPSQLVFHMPANLTDQGAFVSVQTQSDFVDMSTENALFFKVYRVPHVQSFQPEEAFLSGRFEMWPPENGPQAGEEQTVKVIDDTADSEPSNTDPEKGTDSQGGGGKPGDRPAHPQPKSPKKKDSYDIHMVDSQGNEYILSRPKSVLDLKGHEREILDLVWMVSIAAVFSLICEVCGQPVILGFLIGGIVVGPHCLDRVNHIVQMATLGEIGVVLLLFGLGLEFHPVKVAAVKTAAFMGAFVSLLCFVGIGVTVSLVMGTDVSEGLFIGAFMSMSSTTICLKDFVQKKTLDTLEGQITIGILVMQDVVLGLLLAVLPAVSGNGVSSDSLLTTVGKVLWPFFSLAIYCIVVFLLTIHAVRPGLRRVLHHAGSNKEVVLLIAVGYALIFAVMTDALGLSKEMGAFVAGMTLTQLPHTQVELCDALVAPVRDFLSSIFFMCIGLVIDPLLLYDNLPAVLAVIASMTLCKFFVLAPVVKASGYSTRLAVRVALMLSHIGEFAFVLAAKGMALGMISRRVYLLLIGTAALSLFVTPFLLKLVPSLVPLNDPALTAPRPVPLPSGSINSEYTPVGKMEEGGINGTHTHHAHSHTHLNPARVRPEPSLPPSQYVHGGGFSPSYFAQASPLGRSTPHHAVSGTTEELDHFGVDRDSHGLPSDDKMSLVQRSGTGQLDRERENDADRRHLLGARERDKERGGTSASGILSPNSTNGVGGQKLPMGRDSGADPPLDPRSHHHHQKIPASLHSRAAGAGGGHSDRDKTFIDRASSGARVWERVEKDSDDGSPLSIRVGNGEVIESSGHRNTSRGSEGSALSQKRSSSLGKGSTTS